MKKTFVKFIQLISLTMLILVFGVVSASAASTAYCTGETINVDTYAELKDALENYKSGQNIVLQNSIDITDNSNNVSINIKNSGSVALDLNGYTLTVNSSSTKYLFNVTGQTRLYFVNGNKNIQSVIYFNTTKSSAATVRADNKLCEIYNINLKFIMGDNSAYASATDSSDTAVFSVGGASEMNIYGGTIINRMTNGNGVVVDSNDNNSRYLNFRIGGQAKIQSNKYCVSFDPAYVKNENFGSLRFESINSNKSLYERIKVPSGNTLTAKTLWYTSAEGSETTIYNGSILPISKDKKIADFKKADIRADKICETLNNTEYYTALYYSGGHVELCGTCLMAYNLINEHNERFESGSSATCTSTGMTAGYTCTECYYSSRTVIPKTGHLMKFVEKKNPTCGVDGVKEHYYCNYCRNYFTDVEGKNSVLYNTLSIPNNHKVKTYAYVAPTCEKEGLTEGKVCLTCGRVIKSQQVIPKNNHDYPSYWSVVTLSDCKTEGVRKKVCRNCGDEIYDALPKAAHDYDGNGKCYVCGKFESDPESEVPGSGNDNNNNNDNNDSTVNCSCSCHKKGILNWFFKFIIFFQKIFKTNQFCKGCGVAHY